MKCSLMLGLLTIGLIALITFQGGIEFALAEDSSDKCLLDLAAIEDMKSARKEIEEKGSSLKIREDELSKKEQALELEFKKLKELRDQLEALQSNVAKSQESKVAKLVETLEGMSPKIAADIISSVDEGLAVEAIEKISTDKLAKIMNKMDKAVSAKLSESLALGIRRRLAQTKSNSEGVQKQ